MSRTLSAGLSADQIARLNRSRQCVPQYLFRAASNESRGINTMQNIIPDARLHMSIENIHKVKDMITDHLKYKYVTPSEFVSWSSSLLFVLLHAIRKQRFLKEHEIQVIILDTYMLRFDKACKITGPEAIYPAADLCSTLDIPNEGKTRHDGFIHEYLFHGALENTGCYDMISLEALVDHDLYRLSRELYFDHVKLKRQDSDLRRELLRPGSEHVSYRDVQFAEQLGQLYTKNFALPMTIAFLTLKRLPDDWEENVLPHMARKLSSMAVPDTYIEGEWDDQYPVCDEKGLLDVTQFRDTMRELVSYYREEGRRAIAML